MAKTNINMEREVLQRVQRVLGVTPHGKFEGNTHKALFAYQREHRLTPTGWPDAEVVEHILAREK